MHLMQICLDLFLNSFHAVVPGFALSIASVHGGVHHFISYMSLHMLVHRSVHMLLCICWFMFSSLLQVTNDTATEMTANGSSRRLLAETVSPCQECVVPSDATSLQSSLS